MAREKRPARSRLWLLDVDGTLLHLPVPIETVRREVARTLGSEDPLRPLLPGIQAEARRRGAGDPEREAELLARAYGVLDRAELRAAEGARAIAGAAELLRRLGQEPVILFSNNAAPAVERALEVCGLVVGRCPGVVGRRPGVAPKPSPAGVLPLVRGMDPAPEELVAVGDRAGDMAMARELERILVAGGWTGRVTALGVCGRLGGRDALQDAGADRVVDRLTDVLIEISPVLSR